MGTHTEINSKEKSRGLIIKDKDGVVLQENDTCVLKIGKGLELENGVLIATGGGADTSKNKHLKEVEGVLSDVLTQSGLQGKLYSIQRESNADNIGDGGSDIYDNGNIIIVNNATVTYGNNVGGTYILEDDQAFVYEGIIFYKKRNVVLTKFQVKGNYGSDGNTQKSIYSFDITVNGIPIAVFVGAKQGDDPSTNTIMYIVGGQVADFNFVDTITATNNDNYDYTITPKIGTPTRTIGCITIARNTSLGTTSNFTEDEVKGFVLRFLEGTV